MDRGAEKAEYSKSEYLNADELLTDKKKEVEQAQWELFRVTEELDEATRKNEVAEMLLGVFLLLW